MGILQFEVRDNFFFYFFSSLDLTAWNNLVAEIRHSPSYLVFQKNLLDLMGPRSNNIFNVSYQKGLVFLTRLHIGLSL